MGYWWLTRFRYCVFICWSMGLVLFLLNINFIFAPEADKLYDYMSIQANSSKINLSLLIKSSEFEIENSQELTYQINFVNTRLFLTSAPPTNAQTRIIINSTRATSSSSNRLNGMKSESEDGRYVKLGDHAECEAALAKSQWTLWNLLDLALSSLGPFVIILALNLAIILRISTQNRYATHHGPHRAVLRDEARELLALECESQLVQRLLLSRAQTERTKAAKDSIAERSVTYLLLLTTATFVVMRTPIVVGHLLQMMFTEERLFNLVEPVTCMAAFAVAEVLAFGEHAIQFYVNFACSARFRQALFRHLRTSIYRLGLLFTRFAQRPPILEETHPIPLGFLSPSSPWQTPHSPWRSPTVPRSSTQTSAQCQHAFTWIDPHILMCRLCLHVRVVHHPSCHHFRDEQRLECECLMSSIEHPAHLVVHLGDRQSPFFGL